METIFLLSPARCDGRRAKILLNPTASFDLAVRTRTSGAPIGEIFSFLSGLYFRGKIAYARAFGRRERNAPTHFVITTDRGLVTPDTLVTRDDLVAFGCVDLAEAGDAYITPLARDVQRLAGDVDATARVVLLGSIATGKYVDTLTA